VTPFSTGGFQDQMYGKRVVVLKDLEPKTCTDHHGCNELNCDSMHQSLKTISGNYSEQYAKSGFPPKICSLIMK